MSFFEHQDRARKSSRNLLIWFGLAVAAVILSVYLAVSLAFNLYMMKEGTGQAFVWFSLPRLLVVMSVTVLIIGLAMAGKLSDLKGGGAAVAEALGGRSVSRHSEDPGEARLLNVVEEMALASGLPVPQVFILDDEEGINAFAAGHTPADAAVAVTRGALDSFTRDELQGVIAHEFSHILNGDMGLNMRLIGLLAGIVIIGHLGYLTIRLLGSGRRTSRSSKGGGLIVIIVAVGLLLMIAGYVGTFIGRVIQAAISRQREYLADASAVQFTRNPGGILGALRRIAGGESELESSGAAEVAHMFIANGVTSLLAGNLYSTHPPMRTRIDRIRELAPALAAEAGRAPAGTATRTAGAVSPPGRLPMQGLVGATAAVAAVARVGAAQATGVVDASQVINRIPDKLRSTIDSTLGAMAAVCALLLDGDEAIRDRQLAAVEQYGPQGLCTEVRGVLPALKSLDRRYHLPLVDLAAPALARMTAPQYAVFKKVMDALIQADQKVSLFELALQKLVERRVGATFRPRGAPRRGAGLDERGVIELMSALAWAGARDEEQARDAFGGTVTRLDPTLDDFHLLPQDGISYERLSRLLGRYADLPPLLKKDLLTAAAECVMHDRELTVEEAELLRAVAFALDLPLPPFVQ